MAPPRQARPARSSKPPPPSALAAVGGGLIGGTPSAAAGAAGLASGAAAQRSIASNAVKAILAMLALLALRRRKLITERVLAAYPKADIADALAEEDRREVIFRKRVEQRMRVSMKLATSAKDPSARMVAIENATRREQRFAEMRSAAAGERVLASAELQELRTLSPQGAYWSLGPRREHTPDCIAMNGKFWPWAVLDKVHPLLHVGCGCFLLSFGEAISKGLMKPGDVMSDAVALRLAAPIIKHVEEEQAAAELKYGHLAESATNELLAREALLDQGADADLLAASPLGCEALLFTPAEITESIEEDGAMVALYPDPKLAKTLALSGGTKPEQLHVTLAFLGPKADELPFDKARDAVAAWAKTTPKLSGTLSGVGHFDVGKGTKVTYRSVDLPDLPAPREKLVKALDAAGTPPSRDHGFTPHMTVDDKLRRPKVEQQPISFASVTLTWGEERHTFSLEGK